MKNSSRFRRLNEYEPRHLFCKILLRSFECVCTHNGLMLFLRMLTDFITPSLSLSLSLSSVNVTICRVIHRTGHCCFIQHRCRFKLDVLAERFPVDEREVQWHCRIYFWRQDVLFTRLILGKGVHCFQFVWSHLWFFLTFSWWRRWQWNYKRDEAISTNEKYFQQLKRNYTKSENEG